MVTVEEQKKILGEEVYKRFQDGVVVHDPYEDDLVKVGTTSFGNEVLVNPVVAQCDKRILTGGIVYHYFAGFGGGRKSVLPGVCGYDTICANHALLVDDEQDKLREGIEIGRLDGNPLSEEMEEATKLLGVDFIFNTVLDAQGKIIGAFAGHWKDAHRAGCEFARKVYGIPLKQKADIVIATAGGARNWIQSHKSLYNASLAVKEEGVIILLAECPEGLEGERLHRFEGWLDCSTPINVLQRYRSEPELLGTTAHSTLTCGPKTILVSSISPQKIRKMQMTPAQDIKQAMQLAQQRISKPNPTCILMPAASQTVPIFKL